MSDQSPCSDHEHGYDRELDDADGSNPLLFASERADESAKARDADNLTALQPVSTGSEHQITDAKGNPLASNIQINAQLRGRFSQSEKSVTSNSSNGGHQDALELIFYRRNKFKVLGVVAIPSGIDAVRVQNTNRVMRITALHAELDAIESLEAGAVRVLQSLPASSQSTRHAAGKKSNGELSKLDLGFDGSLKELRSVPIAWERLQFRHATAKKRGTWQYFYLRVTVTATLEDGSSQVLCQTQSAAITVRGRSPQSFPDTNKRKNSAVVPTVDSQNLSNDKGRLSYPIDCDVHTSDNLLFYDFSDLGAWNDALQWHDGGKESGNQEYVGGVEAGLTSPSPHDQNSINNDPFIPSMETSLLPSIPDLDAIFNLPNPLSTMTIDNMHLFPQMPATPASSKPQQVPSLHLRGSSNEDDEEEEEERSTYSYEYIPLSINDWTVPVDAVYRPHGVHARKVPDTGPSVTKKRYFLAAK